MSPRRASLPPPLPPLRARPDCPSASATGRPSGQLAAPSRSRRGHKYNKQTIKTFNTCATIVPTPAPSPASRLPGHAPRWRSGRARSDARCPLPLPAGAFNYINTYHSTQLLCVRPPPTLQTIFFSFARSFTWVHASLRFGLGPGERPRKGFAASHTIKAIVNNV